MGKGKLGKGKWGKGKAYGGDLCGVKLDLKTWGIADCRIKMSKKSLKEIAVTGKHVPYLDAGVTVREYLTLY